MSPPNLSRGENDGDARNIGSRFVQCLICLFKILRDENDDDAKYFRGGKRTNLFSRVRKLLKILGAISSFKGIMQIVHIIA